MSFFLAKGGYGQSSLTVLGKNSRGKNSREKKTEGKKGRGKNGRWKKQPIEKTADRKKG